MARSDSLEDILEQLGVKIVSSSSSEVACACPFHDDKHPSFSMNLRQKVDRDGTLRPPGLWICLAGETQVWTWEGLRPISELAGTTQRLLTSAGWRYAPIKEFGVQQLWKIELSRTGRKKTIYATAEHKWFVAKKPSGKREKVTSDLRSGDCLVHRAFPAGAATTLSPWGIAHGFTFGDGWLQDGHRASSVTMWGEKDRQMLKYFPLSPTCEDSNPDSDIKGIRVMNLPRFWKSFPDLEESPSYLFGWLAGYFAADGSVSKQGSVRLTSSRRENLEFVQLLCARLGITTFEIGYQIRKGKGKKPTKSFYLDFVRSSLIEDFYLLDEHKSRSRQSFSYERLRWQVVSVEPSNRIEPVYCAVVEETHDFVLEGNILTGNCYQCGRAGTLSGLILALGGDESGLSVTEVLRGIKSRNIGKPVEEITEQEVAFDPYVIMAQYETFRRPPRSFLEERKFGRDVAQEYGLRWDRGWVIPIWGTEEKPALWGWQYKQLKYVSNYPTAIKKSKTLFGLKELKATEGVALVESPLDVCRLAAVGVPAVAAYGAYVSNAQIKLLVEAADEVILALDNDEAGQEQTLKIHRLLSKFVAVRKAVLPDGAKDPGDLDDRQALKVFA